MAALDSWSALVLVIVVVLGSGWRYHGRPLLIVTILVGLVAGALGGAVQITGPPVVLFWLSSMASAATVRANFIVFFALFASALVVTYLCDRPAHAGSDRARGLRRAAAHRWRCGRGAQVFHFASETDLPPRRLRDHHARRDGQHAAVGRVAAVIGP